MNKIYIIIGLLLVVIFNVGIFNGISSQNSINLEEVCKIQSVSAEVNGSYVLRPYSQITGMSTFSIYCEDGSDGICVVVEMKFGITCHNGGTSACKSHDSVGTQTTCPCDPS